MIKTTKIFKTNTLFRNTTYVRNVNGRLVEIKPIKSEYDNYIKSPIQTYEIIPNDIKIVLDVDKRDSSIKTLFFKVLPDGKEVPLKEDEFKLNNYIFIILSKLSQPMFK